MGSTLGRIFRVTTYGESHGEALGCVIENCPAGLALTVDDIQPDLDRRRPGQSRITTPRDEPDRARILSGTFEDKTIGAPIAIAVFNENAREKDYSDIKEIFRPSHADYTYHARYGHRAWRGGGRSSARATIGIVAAGAIAKKILREKAGVEIVGYVSQIKNLKFEGDIDLSQIRALRETIEANPVRVPDSALADKMVRLIQDTRQAGDSLGGVVECAAVGVPAGWGDPVFDRLDALIAQAMLAIPATKGIEIGSGFAAAELTGREHNDIFEMQNGKVTTRTNHSGGIQGGISNGMPVTFRVAFKPTATISHEQPSVNERGENVTLKVKGRHDPCVLPRAVPIVEAMLALVLVDQFLLSQTARYENLSI
ncbi:chorismate synthase [Turneriella parva]|uniref:Chorismate synthase n=1 Tax=Turneriella parva (strain ATCC BAA-1111 / DSM 21527 / NCTC 11395 / H) TaxID=869212 RepID=I4B2N7_TURPD|nr:chorismate synthase [Turneriella parva]AFM11544.1 chorismate synthase [Turneriella parva DSM 21527]